MWADRLVRRRQARQPATGRRVQLSLRQSERAIRRRARAPCVRDLQDTAITEDLARSASTHQDAVRARQAEEVGLVVFLFLVARFDGQRQREAHDGDDETTDERRARTVNVE